MAAISEPPIYYDATFGGIDLLIVEIETETGRDVAVQSPSRGDKHVLQDRGRTHTVAHVEILFCNQPGLQPYTFRYDQFRSLVNTGDAQIFSHPLDGSYRVRASGLTVRANSEAGEIRCSCTFLAEDEPQVVYQVGAGTTPTAGVAAVTTAASDADAQLAAVGLSTPATAACAAAVTDWSTTDNLDSQAVFVGVASLTQQISDAVDELELAQDLSRWQAYRAMIQLSFQVQRAGEAFTSSSGQNFSITVGTAQPLLAICSQVYGADLAPDMATKVQQLNRVRTPGRVPKGTILKMPPVPS